MKNPTLQRASFGYLLRHPVQLLLALLGIAIGVAVIVAVDLANGSARQAFRLSLDAVTGAATHQVVAGPAGVDESLYKSLRVTAAEQRIAPVIEGYAELDGQTFRVFGIDPFAEREFRDYSWPDDGDNDTTAGISTFLGTPGAVLLTAETAAELGLQRGQAFELRVNGKARSAVLAGFLPTTSRDAELQNLILSDIATAQDWFEMRGRISRIDVRRDSEDAVERLRDALPAGAQLLTATSRTQAVTEMSRAFMVNLTAMSLLALLVGVFLIYNSVSFAVLQRRSLIAVLRALGVTRAELLQLILGEALVLGVAGSAVGLVAGIWLSETLLQLVAQSINDLYFQITVTEVALDRWSIVKGFVAGILATLIAAFLPAMEASAYKPRLGMQRASLERRTGRLLPSLALAGVLLIVAMIPLLRLSSQSLVAGLVALFMLILGIAFCIPWCARALLKVLAPIAGFVGGDLSRLTVAGIGANMSRTGVAIVALSVAVSATVGVTVMVDSFRLSVSDWLDHTLQADMYVAPVRGSLDSGLADELQNIDGVAQYSSSRRVWLESKDRRTRLTALQMAPGSYAGIDLLDTAVDDVWQAFEEEGSVLVSEAFGFRFDAGPGDVVRLPTDRGERAFRIAATYRSYDSQPEGVLMSRSIYDMFWEDPDIDALGFYLADNADAASVVAAVGTLSLNRQSLDVRSNQELRELSLTIFDRTFIITNVLYWLALGVAIVGILSATLALQMERSREFATLRALGVTHRQLGTMVTLQSVLMGLLSGFFAIPLGVLMARLLIDVINRRAFGWSMPVTIGADVLWSALLLASVAALVAGLFPAWQAGRRPPALAMRED